ncbi:anti-sigma factor [Serinicoccus kebangsaanensis]|uniref:anti-sigma factor n=1 Tax=Serinicoccus kebangsaanensis TaxID=2602069 RepID=UPI00178C5870|nr:anti-sigma factor [Serinicoccus kebangsaanensis]
MNDDELELSIAEALTPAPVEPPEDRIAALRQRAELARAERAHAGHGHEQERAADPTGARLRSVDTDVSPAPRRARPAGSGTGTRWWMAGAVAASLALGAVIGGTALDGDPEDEVLARGVPEFEATLDSDGAVVAVEGSLAPEGRIVRLRSDTLPDLPVGEYYELWFLAPGDGPDGLDRISGGTFHPSYDGSGTDVVLHAAVDPELYPTLEITRELPDGDPQPSDDVVLRGEVSLLAEDGR